jgi:hypothetical protein
MQAELARLDEAIRGSGVELPACAADAPNGDPNQRASAERELEQAIAAART